ncbi:biotin transporter BioY [Natronobacterium gregoryi]|uniref:BioY protein n=2 Tax=Natronobacterium gregoryi TaxID=44930 RepID=L0AL46_NATGS|nr:biotin transporter BioY [Natronobacterium gregoryi]AFZ73917.1 hypothetical protein Natgr_2772 [Natronobacterium gregoryi SP2]ELY71561.1 BioY protein [Natronobacterium gregoryi SP2]PLK19060.1 biotin transporter BioY [Natronobacterium gregoryi SP2]SFJ63163.1 biotin transport system substrate-specific component [Natronobacterium gregoryi]
METEHGSVQPVDDGVVRQFARAALFAALIGAAAQITIPIPFTSIPLTLQVLFVFLAGIVLGPVWGGLSMVLYLAAGTVGAPIFAGMTGGPGVLVGETGGFLLSYPIAAALIGLLVHRGTDLRDPATVSVPALGAVLVAATAIIYAMGAGYTAWLFELSIREAVVASALPFLPFELLKMAAAIAIVKTGRIRPAGT